MPQRAVWDALRSAEYVQQEWLSTNLEAGATVGVDGFLYPYAAAKCAPSNCPPQPACH